MTHKTFMRAKAVALALSAFAAAQLAPSANAQLDAVLSAQAGANQAAEASQERIDKLADEGQDLANKYRKTLSDADSIKRYAEELGKQVESQRQEIASLQSQLDAVDTVNRDVFPLMQKMVDSLEQFVALDVPFLPKERTDRIQRLKELMASANVTVSEKYRRIMEAYGIEMEYGRTIDAVEGTIGEGDEQRAVKFVRVGRVALMYQTLDGAETGYWDVEKKSWVRDDDYHRDFQGALDLAEEKGAPDLLFVPVPAAREVQS
jgi:DNA repair exonuclease SbcCD ATPase subunit